MRFAKQIGDGYEESPFKELRLQFGASVSKWALALGVGERDVQDVESGRKKKPSESYRRALYEIIGADRYGEVLTLYERWHVGLAKRVREEVLARRDGR